MRVKMFTYFTWLLFYMYMYLNSVYLVIKMEENNIDNIASIIVVWLTILWVKQQHRNM